MKRILALLVAGLMGCAPFDGLPCLPGQEARWVLQDLAAGTGPSSLKASTPQPQRTTVSFATHGVTLQLDLYRTSDSPMAAIVLVPGASEAGKDDPRLVGLAHTLARARFVVGVPELTGLTRFELRSDHAQEVADALSHMARDAALVPQGRIGIGAFSYAVAPALKAALTPAVRDKVAFVLALGGYHDIFRELVFFTTGYYLDPAGQWQYREPLQYGKWVFVVSNAAHFAEDEAALRALAQRKLQDPQADISQDLARLGPQGQALMALIQNRDPDQVATLYAGLPDSLKRAVAALDLKAVDLSAMQARVILVHGRSDDSIPYTESLSLYQALPKDRTRLFVVEGVTHVNVLDGWSLGCAVEALLAERAR